MVEREEVSEHEWPQGDWEGLGPVKGLALISVTEHRLSALQATSRKDRHGLEGPLCQGCVT